MIKLSHHTLLTQLPIQDIRINLISMLDSTEPATNMQLSDVKSTMWICNASCNCFRCSSRSHESNKVHNSSVFVVINVVLQSHLHQLRLDGFVDDEMDDRLRYAEIGGSQTLVEATKPILVVYSAYAGTGSQRISFPSIKVQEVI